MLKPNVIELMTAACGFSYMFSYRQIFRCWRFREYMTSGIFSVASAAACITGAFQAMSGGRSTVAFFAGVVLGYGAGHVLERLEWL